MVTDGMGWTSSPPSAIGESLRGCRVATWHMARAARGLEEPLAARPPMYSFISRSSVFRRHRPASLIPGRRREGGWGRAGVTGKRIQTLFIPIPEYAGEAVKASAMNAKMGFAEMYRAASDRDGNDPTFLESACYGELLTSFGANFDLNRHKVDLTCNFNVARTSPKDRERWWSGAGLREA